MFPLLKFDEVALKNSEKTVQQMPTIPKFRKSTLGSQSIFFTHPRLSVRVYERVSHGDDARFPPESVHAHAHVHVETARRSVCMYVVRREQLLSM